MLETLLLNGIKCGGNFNNFDFLNKNKPIQMYIETMRIKLLLLLCALFNLGNCVNAQENWPVSSAGLEGSAYNLPFNKEKLNVDPFGEYGDQYLYSQQFGFNFSMDIYDRFSPMLGVGVFNYFTESYSINPFPDSGSGSVLSSNSENAIQGVDFYARLRIIALKKAKFRLLVGTGYQAVILDKVIESSTFFMADEVILTSQLTRPIGGKLYPFLTASVSAEFRLSKHLYAGLDLQFTSGKIPLRGFTDSQPDSVSKLDLGLPIRIMYKW